MPFSFIIDRYAAISTFRRPFPQDCRRKEEEKFLPGGSTPASEVDTLGHLSGEPYDGFSKLPSPFQLP